MDIVHAAYLHVHGLESAATVLPAPVAVRSLYYVSLNTQESAGGQPRPSSC